MSKIFLYGEFLSFVLAAAVSGGSICNAESLTPPVTVALSPPAMLADCGSPGSSEASDLYQWGQAARARSNYGEAMRLYREAAEKGHLRSTTLVGIGYHLGWGVPQDNAEALHWARRAADAGEPGAMNFVGNFFRFGWGVPQDYAEAMRWYRRAAEHTGPFAAFGMSNAGDLYWNGWGVQQDRAEAVRWYYRAAQNGGSWGMNNLAWAIEHGDGIGKDIDTAVQWYRRAAALRSDPDQRGGAEQAARNLSRFGY